MQDQRRVLIGEKITAVRLDRMRLPLDPPFHAAGDPVPRARAEAAVAAKAAGFRAMKIRISRTDWVSSLEAVRATWAAVGDEIALMADLNQRRPDPRPLRLPRSQPAQESLCP